MSKKTKAEDRVFGQPKGDTPLARAMSIPWVDAGIKPEVHGEEGDSYKQSKKPTMGATPSCSGRSCPLSTG